MSGFVTGTPKLLLRAEAALILAGAAVAYAHLGASWMMFTLLFFVPDAFMLGYLAGPRTGAAMYNVGHWYGSPLVVLGLGAFALGPTAIAIGLIWAGHIAFDRMLGYGLKYEDGFGSSHLGILGQTKSTALARTEAAV